jgi:ankyrin repeat protein
MVVEDLISQEIYDLVPESFTDLLKSEDNYGLTALSVACKNGHAEVVEKLLACKLPIGLEHRDSEGRTPLMLAVYSKNEPLATHLLERKVVIEARDLCGRTVLSRAAADGPLEMVRLLIAHGADIRSVSASGRSPLMQAVDKDKFQIAKLLLQYGSDVNLRDGDGRTSLFLAVKNENETMLRLLLENGAAVEVKDYKGFTPMSITPDPDTSVSMSLRGSTMSLNSDFTVAQRGDNLRALLRQYS